MTITNVTFDHNQTMVPSALQQVTGGAMNIFGNSPTFTISNSTFTNNSTATTTAAGGAIYYRSQGGSLAIHNTDFNGNTAGGLGGGIYLNITNASTVVTIDQGTQIRNNVSGGVAGGSAGGSGIFIGGNVLTTTPVSLSKVVITGNSESALSSPVGRQGGGGILVNEADATISYSRIADNTVLSASGGTGLLKDAVDTGTVTATNNWWGCSTGPSAAPCDTAVILGGPGTLTTSPFLRLKTTASPSTINVGQGSSITSTFLTDSANNPVALVNLNVLIGLPVTWSATHGSLSGQQATIQASGTATASFTQDNTCNNINSVTAKVDNGPNSGGPNTAVITVQCPDLTVTKTNDVAGATQLTNSGVCPPQCWNWTLTGANGGAGFATFTNGATIVTDNLPNANISFGSVVVTPVAGITGTISCAINGSDDLSCTANGPVQIASGGSFTTGFSATPTAAAVYNNPRGGGACAIDPGGVMPESNEANNACANSVTVNAPDLTVVKSNNVSGTTVFDNGWTWKLHVANTASNATAVFLNGDTVLTDDLPNSNISYGSPSAGNASHVTNLGDVTCSITSDTLTCSVTGPGPVTIGSSGFSGSFDVTFTAAPTQVGAFANPRGGGSCAVDPDNVVPETNDANNNCNTDTVTVSKANTTTTITSHTPNPSTFGVDTVTVDYSVTVNPSGSGTPTGNVTVDDGLGGAGDSCVASVATGTCDLNPSAPGSLTLTATYAGDTNFNGSVSAGVSQTVTRPNTTITSINRQTPSSTPTNATSVVWRVTFADPVFGLTASNFSLANTGLTAPSISTVTAVSASPDTQWDVTANTGSGDGTLGLNLANDTSLSHHVTTSLPFTGQTYTIDKTAPLVASIKRQSPASNPTNADVLVFRVTFNEAVTNVGANSFVASGTTTPINGSVTAITPNLVFDFTIDGTADGGDLSTLNGTVGLDIASSPAIKDLAGNTLQVVAPTPAATNDQTYTVDNTGPTVTDVSSTSADGAYGTAAVIPITVQFSEPVTVTGGTPRLTLATGGAGEIVDYTSGSGSDTLTFTYTVQAGDNSADLDYVGTTSLVANGATLTDAATNAADLTLASPAATHSLGFNKNIAIDTTAPLVTDVSSTSADGAYTTGAVIPVTVTFNRVVIVTGTPELTLNTGGAGEVISYTGGSGTTTLTFTYTVQAGDNSADLDYVATTSLALNGGTIKDGANNAADLTLSTPGTAGSLGFNKNIVIDTTAPTITDVSSSSANGTYSIGAVIPVTVQFSEPVTATGTPQLTLDNGGAGAVVNYTSGSGSDTLTFNYTVQAGDTSADLDYVGTTSLALNGGTIKDAATNAAVLTLAVPGNTHSLGFNKNIVIDGVAPTVTGVSSTAANGTYGIGAVIPVTVQFSEPVIVTGTPQLTLDNGGAGAVVNYASGSGSDTLTFNYTVASGDVSADLDYTATTSLALNGGTIKDAATNAAVLTLASPGAAGSLGANKNIVIDGIVPTVSMSSVALNPTNGSPIPVTVLFSESVTGFTLSDITPGNGTVGNFAGSGTSYSFDLTPSGQGTVTADIAANKAVDTANNGNTAATQFSRTYDSVAPTAVLSTLVSSPINSSPILVTITFNEPVTGVGAGDLSATNGTTSIPTGGPTVYTFNLTPSGQGLVTVKYLAGSASDLAGNPNTADSNTLSITFDTVAPDTAILGTPSNPSTSSNATFTFIGSDVGGSGVSSTSCSLDGSSYSSCTSPKNYTGLGLGSHTFQVRATDNAGNTDASPASYTWTVNVVNVTINQAVGQADPTNVSPIHFTAVFSSLVSGFTGSGVTLGGTAGGTLSAVVTEIAPLNGTTYDVAVSGMTTSGTVIASIGANVVAGSNLPSTSSDNTVTYTNVPPVITGGGSVSVTMSQNGAPTPFALTLYATDANSDPLTWSIISQANFGTASVDPGTGVVSYTPLNNYYGVDEFVVQVADPYGGTASINVGVIIQPNGNPGPLIWNQSYGIQYDTWIGVIDPSAFNGGYRKATFGQFKFVATVASTQVTWLTYRGPDQGKAQVLVDGSVKATIDLYNATPQWQYPVSITGLTNKKHTVVIKVLDARSRRSSGVWVVVDGFKVGTTIYDDQTILYPGMFSYGSWLGLRSSQARFDGYRISNTAHASMQFSFDGIGFNWVTVRGPSYGKAAIYVDGVLKQTVDLYKAGAEKWQYKVTIGGLAYGHHTVTIVVLGTKNSHSTGTSIICDGFEIF
jgi:hypothetical protein